MSQFRVRGLPPIRLLDLLKKRRTNLKEFLKNTGIAAYSTLELKCQKLGVSVPTEEEFNLALGTAVSSPQEGVIVLDPPKLTKDTGEKTNVDDFSSSTASAPEALPVIDAVQTAEQPQKKKYTKKDS